MTRTSRLDEAVRCAVWRWSRRSNTTIDGALIQFERDMVSVFAAIRQSAADAVLAEWNRLAAEAA